MRSWYRMAPILLLLVAGGALSAPDAGELARLVNAGEMERAWAYARAHRAELEGEPAFDLHYGIAALETGHPQEAVFALRRVLAARPGHGRARVALARAYFEAGNDLLARREFERILASDPPAPLRAAAERYLRALDRRAGRYRTVLSGHFEFGAGHDSNVNSATTLDSVDSPDGTLLIDERGQEQADDFARVGGAARVDHPLTPDLGAFAAFGFERRYLDEHDAFEIGSTLLRAGLIARGDSTRSSLGLHGQRVRVGGEAYRDMGGIDGNVRHALSDRHVIGLSGRYSQLDYETLQDRDSDLWELDLRTTLLWSVPLRPVASFSLLVGEERARRDTAEARGGTERDLHGAGGELRLRLAPRWELGGEVHYRHSRYAGPDPVFDERREDDYYSARLLLEWRMRPAWRLQLRLTRAVNESNLDFHDHERDVAELLLRRAFRR